MWYVTCGGYVLTNAILVYPNQMKINSTNSKKKKKMYKIIIIHILGTYLV